MENGNKKPKSTLHFWIFPAVPLLIVLIWIVMMVLYFTVGLSRTIATPVVLATVVYFIIWLWRAVRRNDG